MVSGEEQLANSLLVYIRSTFTTVVWANIVLQEPSAVTLFSTLLFIAVEEQSG